MMSSVPKLALAGLCMKVSTSLHQRPIAGLVSVKAAITILKDFVRAGFRWEENFHTRYWSRGATQFRCHNHIIGIDFSVVITACMHPCFPSCGRVRAKLTTIHASIHLFTIRICSEAFLSNPRTSRTRKKQEKAVP